MNTMTMTMATKAGTGARRRSTGGTTETAPIQAIAPAPRDTPATRDVAELRIRATRARSAILATRRDRVTRREYLSTLTMGMGLIGGVLMVAHALNPDGCALAWAFLPGVASALASLASLLTREGDDGEAMQEDLRICVSALALAAHVHREGLFETGDWDDRVKRLLRQLSHIEQRHGTKTHEAAMAAKRRSGEPEVGARVRTEGRVRSFDVRITPRRTAVEIQQKNGRPRRARIIDISPSGVALATEAALRVGETIRIGTRHANVVRQFDKGYGLQFVERIATAKFNEDIVL